MSDETTSSTTPAALPPRWFWLLTIVGAFLSLRGYHSFDGDQAYRLPLLVDRQDPTVYATDPFVRAFDVFNPHRGYLTLLDVASRPWGLATGLFVLFALTMIMTMVGVDRLARLVWPGLGVRVGLVAMVLVLVAKAGNIGTNHLFEATLLDRLVAFGLGWVAISAAVADPRRGAWVAAPLLGLAALVHPSVGLQLTLTLGVSWLVWAVGSRGSAVTVPGAVGSVLALVVALLPGMILIGGQSGQLLVGMPVDEFREWAIRVQGPQHMLPMTWRRSQWLAFGCYPVLAGLSYLDRRGEGARNPAATRFSWLLGVNLCSLTLAYVAVEVVKDLRVTLFQPFRMATLTRGLCLVAIAERLVALWGRGDLASRGRAVLGAVSLAGDWTLVVATLVELAATLAERWGGPERARGVVAAALGVGLIWLARHDTESGQVAILGALGLLVVGVGIARVRPLGWNRRRLAFLAVATWTIPVLAWGSALIWGDRVADDPVRRALVGRCRFAEVPVDPLERIAVWCRDQTPRSSRFIGPPGDKEFRLWARRPLAFNRAGSPYHAAGLRDWSERFRDHVGFTGTATEFAAAYLAGRHDLEAGYDQMTPGSKLALARRQGATHVLERGPARDLGPGLVRVATEGEYAIYQVRVPD